MKLESKPMFPIIAGQQVYGDGLSTRDYTAIMAMQGIVSAIYPIHEGSMSYENVAMDSYKIADAMMKAGGE